MVPVVPPPTGHLWTHFYSFSFSPHSVNSNVYKVVDIVSLLFYCINIHLTILYLAEYLWWTMKYL